MGSLQAGTTWCARTVQPLPVDRPNPPGAASSRLSKIAPEAHSRPEPEDARGCVPEWPLERAARQRQARPQGRLQEPRAGSHEFPFATAGVRGSDGKRGPPRLGEQPPQAAIAGSDCLRARAFWPGQPPRAGRGGELRARGCGPEAHKLLAIVQSKQTGTRSHAAASALPPTGAESGSGGRVHSQSERRRPEPFPQGRRARLAGICSDSRSDRVGAALPCEPAALLPRLGRSQGPRAGPSRPHGCRRHER